MVYCLSDSSGFKERTMKRITALALALAFLAAACARKAENVGLKEGTPAYQLAKDLSAKVPSLDPAANNVLVRTKGFDVTTGEVIQAVRDNVGTRAAQLKDLEAAQMKSVIERSAVQLAEKKLLLDAAVKAKTAAPAGEMEKALKAEQERAGGEQAFLDSLKANEIDAEHVKKSLEEQLLINAFLDSALSKDIAVSPEDVAKAYAEDRTASVRHILLLTQGKTDNEKAEAGEDFAALAKQYSEDPGSKDNGGLYEDFGRGAMVKPFEDAAFSVPVGEISGIVETTYGYHILQIVGRKKEARPLEEAKGEIEARLKQGKQQAAFTAFMTKLKKKAGFETVGF
jgi:parvulin-like peptidyl-prolyl isomerase